MNSTRHRLQGAAWLTAAPIALNFVSIAANAYLIPALGLVEYGLWTTAMALVGASNIITNLGLRQVYIRDIVGTDMGTQQRLLSEQIGLRLLLGSGAAILVPLSAWLLGHTDRVILTSAIYSLALPFSIAWTVLADVLTVREMFRRTAMAGFWAGLVLTLGSVGAAAAGLGAPGVAASYLLGPVVNLVILWHSVSRLGLKVRLGGSLRRYRDMLMRARHIASSDLVTSLMSRVEGIYVPKLVGTTSFGVLSAGRMPANRLDGFSDGIATAHYPQIAAADTRQDEPAVRQLVAELCTMILIVTAPITALLLVLAPSIAAVFYRSADLEPERRMAALVMVITAGALLLTGMSKAFRQSLQAVTWHDRTAKASQKAVMWSPGIGLPLILWLGIPGAALSFMVRRVLVTVFLMRLFMERFPGLLGSLPLVRIVLPSLSVPVFLLVLPVNQPFSLYGTIAAGCAGLAISGIITLLSGLLPLRELPFVGPRLVALLNRRRG